MSTLHAAPSSAAPRGDAAVQPAYFTSSLFVDALRADIRELERVFSKHYFAQLNAQPESDEPVKPFALFKLLWKSLGWQWLHLKVLEPRARESFVSVVLRLFLECTESNERPMLRAVGLFSLYTFYMSQPSTSVPRPFYRAHGIPIQIDSLEALLDFPESLTGSEEALKPYVKFVLQTLQPNFLLLPSSELFAQNPRILPREVIQGDEVELEEGSTSQGTGKKKTGRPSKAEKSQRVRAAVNGLDRWLEKSSYPVQSIPESTTNDPAGAAGLWRPGEEIDSEIAEEDLASEQTTHTMLSQRPMSSLNSYRIKKVTAVNTLVGAGHGDVVDRAAHRVLRRLKEIDAAAAARGLEVGTEGGELSAIGRVEKAVVGGEALSLLEGGGLARDGVS